MINFKANIETILNLEYRKTVKTADIYELYHSVSKAVIRYIEDKEQLEGKEVAFLSQEFTVGKLIYSNLLNLGLLNQFNELMTENGIDTRIFEGIKDAALGDGGLGRQAACFLDSGASCGITLNGYGIRYRYGYFRQYLKDGCQIETVDDWTKKGDPMSIRKDAKKVIVEFKGHSVYAVPYDVYIAGYGGKKINTLRLWQAEPINEFDYVIFNTEKPDKAYKERNIAQLISSIMRPNDKTESGKLLKLKQQYFLASASIKDMVKRYMDIHGEDFSRFSIQFAIQLNDTFSTLAIPEFIRILIEDYGMTFAKTFKIARETFAYTCYDLNVEMLEKLPAVFIKSVIPNVYRYIVLINKSLLKELANMNISEKLYDNYLIIDNQGMVNMVRLAVYSCHSVNGISKFHMEVLTDNVLKCWYELYPERFRCKLNGITQRRWLLLANKELAGFINDKIGDSWIVNLEKIKNLEMLASDKSVVKEFDEVKSIKKRQLAEYIFERERVNVNPEYIFDVHVGDIREYNRQLLNVLSILDIYYKLQDGSINKDEFYPTVYIIGGKATPSSVIEKTIVKYINDVANIINRDNVLKEKMQVVYVTNYDVSYAEKIIPAADICEQISVKGVEVLETTVMKFMLNGAVMIGTSSECNLELIEQMGETNNYIFGNDMGDTLRVYDSKMLYDSEPRLRKVIETFLNETFDCLPEEGYNVIYSLLSLDTQWCKSDNNYILLDFLPYCEARLKANKEYTDRMQFRTKGLINTANAGKFSSDKTVNAYARDVWKVL